MRRTGLVPENGSSGIDMLGEVDGWEEGRYQSAPRYINTPARNSVNIVGRIDVLVGAGGRCTRPFRSKSKQYGYKVECTVSQVRTGRKNLPRG